ncbi:MAG TPA: hypothetical protein VLV54_20935 [Thermoanaerobaculia bacterium]|nr:hypothetical protein [Thermoanaerobaculia bacterium]
MNRFHLPLFLLLVLLGGFAGSAKSQIQVERALPCCPPPTQITTYEELKGCGFYPQESRLACTLQIKQVAGYNGGVDTAGSFEHVLFCADWNGNGAFGVDEVAGEVALSIHDESAGAVVPWDYAVYRDTVPAGGLRTSAANIGTATTLTVGPTVAARAILSWNAAPTGCGFIPQWGNVINFRIRVDPVR